MPSDPVAPPGSANNGHVLHELEPGSVRRVHLVGIAGTGMGALAGMLTAAGYVVTGSDQNVFPPMSELLAASGIPVLTPYRATNLDAARPDVVIIGNVLRRTNPEAAEARARRLPQISFPAALGALFLRDRHPVVVVGTHGKTTVSALMGHVLFSAGREPSFLVGGVLRDSDTSSRLGGGPHFVVEGDEYDTAYFDKRPKFLHYRPRTAILTSIEFDHADIYRDQAHYESAFERFVRLLPSDGLLAVSNGCPTAARIARACPARVVTYAVSAAAGYGARGLTLGPEGARFELIEDGQARGELFLPMAGAHNVENALGVVAAARGLGLSLDEIRTGFATFRGIKRRQEVRADVRGVLVIDDFAHHPTAVRETITAIRHAYPGRRLWALFEPRSNTSRRNVHQAEYARAFLGAARVCIKTPEPHDMVPPDQRLDVARLTEALHHQGLAAWAEHEVDALVARVVQGLEPGDVVLAMSNGAFGGFIDKLVAVLQRSTGRSAADLEQAGPPRDQCHPC